MGLEGEIANGIIHKITTKIIKGGAMEQVAKLLKDFDLRNEELQEDLKFTRQLL